MVAPWVFTVAKSRGILKCCLVGLQIANSCPGGKFTCLWARQAMNWNHIIIIGVFWFVASLVAPIGRRHYARKALRRMRDKGLQAEDLRPKARNWYRIRAGSLSFVLMIAPYPVVQWLFPHMRVDSLLDAAVFVGILLVCSVMAGFEVGGNWQKNADEAYLDAKWGSAND